ncbi:phosphoglycerate dehydrogenase [Candidatus Margulisiibacteriota bacterium]
MQKILISTSSFAYLDPSLIKKLEQKGLNVILNKFGRPLKNDECLELYKDIIGVIAGTENINSAVLKNASLLKVISRCGSGIDNIDLKTADKSGIKIYNTPEAPALAVSELTVGLILNLLRKINLMDRELRNGAWKKRKGNTLAGKTIGLIGFGTIGQKVAKLLSSFNCEVIFYDPRDNISSDIKAVPLEDLLKTSDIISIHISGNKQIIGQQELKLMKETVLILNLSRGGVVSEKALYEALKTNKIGGAALDVFENEPYQGPLKDLDNVIVTPHIGSATKETRLAMEKAALDNLLSGLSITI